MRPNDNPLNPIGFAYPFDVSDAKFVLSELIKEIENMESQGYTLVGIKLHDDFFDTRKLKFELYGKDKRIFIE